MNKALKYPKITLLGYMASGKSTVGKALAKALQLPFYDLDDYIELKEKMSVSDIFEKKSERYFREIEFQYLGQLLRKHKKLVLSVGGGTPLHKNAMELINKKSISIYLKANVSTLAQRLMPNTVERPLLEAIDESMLVSFIDNHMESRRHFYDEATLHFDVDGKQLDKIVNQLFVEVNNRINLQ